MFSRPISLCCCWLAAILASCSSDSPIDSRIGAAAVSAQVGPGGAILRGDGSSPLQGMVLEVPAGALDRLAQLTVEAGPEVEVFGTDGVSTSLRITLSPDPGHLRVPAILTLPIDYPEFRSPDDLAIAARFTVPGARGLTVRERVGTAASFGVYDPATTRFTALVQRLSDLQVRATRDPRLVADADRLVASGYTALARLTDGGLLEADQLFQQAQVADPFSPSARLFRAISRVLVVLNDRTDSGPGLDSIGEALTAIGLDVGSRSLLQRVVRGEWPRRLVLPNGAPRMSDISELLRRSLRPALELSLDDLDRVALDTILLIKLPHPFVTLSGERELDTTDILLLRAALSSAIFAIDWAEDLDLDVDAASLTGPQQAELSVEAFLTRYPDFGRPRSGSEERTLRAFTEAMYFWLQGLESLTAEEDAQDNDLVVFAHSFGMERVDLWHANLRGALDSLLLAGPRTVFLEGGLGTLQVDWLLPFVGSPLDLRAMMPQVFRYLPVAGTLPSPELGGVLPGMTQDRAADLLGMVNLAQLMAATIVVDGDVGDWPGASEVLLPSDPVGDAGDRLEALDLQRVYLARSGDYIAVRLSIAGDSISYRPDQATIYTIAFDEVAAHPGGLNITVDVAIEQNGPEVHVQRDGDPVSVRYFLATRHGELELSLNRFDLLRPDDPVMDRAMRASSLGFQLSTGLESGDRTRPVVIRF